MCASPTVQRCFVCLPTGRTPASLTPNDKLRVEQLIAGQLHAILGDAVVLRRLVSHTILNGRTGHVVTGPGPVGSGRCFVKLAPDGEIVHIATANLHVFTAGNVFFVNDATTLRHYYAPHDIIKWFCPDDMSLPHATGAGEHLQLWPGGPMVHAEAHNAYWGGQPTYAEAAPLAHRSGVAVVKTRVGYITGMIEGATEAQSRAFVQTMFDQGP